MVTLITVKRYNNDLSYRLYSSNKNMYLEFDDRYNTIYFYNNNNLLGKIILSSYKNEVFVGSLTGITSYPSSGGVYRLTGKFKDKLPSSCSYYGTLIIFYVEYCLHILSDTNGNIFIASTNSIGNISSSSWKQIK